MAASGAGRDNGFALPLQSVAHRDGSARSVGHHHRHEERRDSPWAFLVVNADLLFERVQPADARGENGAEAPTIDGDGVDATNLIECFARRSECKLLDAVSPPSLLGPFEVRSAVPIVEHDGPTDGRGRTIQTVPEIAGPDASRSNDTQASDGDPAAARHQSLPATRS